MNHLPPFCLDDLHSHVLFSSVAFFVRAFARSYKFAACLLSDAIFSLCVPNENNVENAECSHIPTPNIHAYIYTSKRNIHKKKIAKHLAEPFRMLLNTNMINDTLYALDFPFCHREIRPYGAPHVLVCVCVVFVCNRLCERKNYCQFFLDTYGCFFCFACRLSFNTYLSSLYFYPPFMCGWIYVEKKLLFRIIFTKTMSE